MRTAESVGLQLKYGWDPFVMILVPNSPKGASAAASLSVMRDVSDGSGGRGRGCIMREEVPDIGEGR